MKILMTILFLIVSSYSQQEADSVGFFVKVGDPSPEFSLVLTNGDTVTLSELKGKVIMLQFTASWCSVCRREMPHIEKDIWQSLQSENLVVFGIDRDEPIEKVIKFAEDMKITYPMALDPGAEIFGLFADKNSGVTRNVIIDKNGKIVFLTRLFKLDEFKEMVSVIKTLLNENEL